ncbi:MAG: TonB-dependent receptor [Myxococcota bacterium]|jgi:iron complex outermembrane receptor protein|nr:TonB-dependent receptor [Myxococcota bacterium]
MWIDLGSPWRLATALLACAHLLPAVALAEATDEPSDRIVVVGERGKTGWIETPASVSVVLRDEIRRGRRQLTLGEPLGQLPGVFVQNRSNFAQDARISIRGFGARTPFGIRGLQLIVDGIPQTLPDGQGQVDSLDLSTASRIEVLRGPGASLYGSAAGGVIEVTSFDPMPQPEASARVSLGFHGYRNYQAQGHGKEGRVRYALGLAHTGYDGHRDHSDTETTVLNTKFRFDLLDTTDLTLIISHADSPEADDPGGLAAEEVAEDRSQANARNVSMKSGEAVENTSVGARLRHEWNDEHETSSAAFFAFRDFDGRVPSTSRGAIDLERVFAGGSLLHTWQDELLGFDNRLQVGFEVKGQRDRREHRAIDLATGSVGALAVDEVQEVVSFGVFAHDRLSLTDTVSLSYSMRYDRVEFDVDDDFTTDAGGDDSDELHFDEWSFSGALVWNPDPRINPFVRIGTSFETPTATALANPDTDAGGFNNDLDAQTSVQYEAGSKGVIADRVEYEAAFFYIRVEDELLPYSRAFSTFYENAKRSDRLGLELAVRAKLLTGLHASANYTWSQFEFDRFTDGNDNDFDGNTIPGVPAHLANFALAYESAGGLFSDFDLQYVSDREADNANSAEADDYVVMGLRAGLRHDVGDWSLEGFFGVQNLGDEEYDDNVRINAGFGRFFEPAPGRSFNVGVGLARSF